MKNKFISILCASAVLLMSGCNDDDPASNLPGTPGQPEGPGDVPASYGAFIVNGGAMYSNIASSLTYFQYSPANVFADVFSSANGGQTLGDVANSGLVYEDNIYIAVTNSSVIHVIDRNTYKLVKTITTPSNAGPRHLTAYNGKLYATLFGQPGYVAEIDPLTLTITRQVEVGPLPEYIVAFNNMLYIAVSDGYGDGAQASVTVVDPSAFTVKQVIKGVVNPVNLVTNGSKLYVCAWGQYLSDFPYTQYGYGLFPIVNNAIGNKICDATNVALRDNLIYYYSNPYGIETVLYGYVNTTDNSDHTWITEAEGVDYPNGIGVDPVTGYVFLLSFNVGEGGYASYTTPGYARIYNADGTRLRDISTGVTPAQVFFNVVE